MSNIIKIAVDAMGGDGSPKKIIDGIIHHYNKNNNTFYKNSIKSCSDYKHNLNKAHVIY